MAHHAFVVTGTEDEAVERARSFAARTLSLSGLSNPDIQTFVYGLLSVEHVRRISTSVYQTSIGKQKVVTIYAARIFHEAQNALLKICEEPPEGVTIVIGVPSLGQLLPTLRSRLLTLTQEQDTSSKGEAFSKNLARVFVCLSTPEREKFIAKVLDRLKSDKEEVKQAARAEAAELVRELLEITHAQYLEKSNTAKRADLLDFVTDLSAFMPLLYERSVPLKGIFEHILLTIPKDLHRTRLGAGFFGVVLVVFPAI